MIRQSLLAVFFITVSFPAYTMGGDDPLLASLIANELEWREDDVLVWDAEA
jgi:hypothetical protein